MYNTKLHIAVSHWTFGLIYLVLDAEPNYVLCIKQLTALLVAFSTTFCVQECLGLMSENTAASALAVG